jgi:hypothetical protein
MDSEQSDVAGAACQRRCLPARLKLSRPVDGRAGAAQHRFAAGLEVFGCLGWLFWY